MDEGYDISPDETGVGSKYAKVTRNQEGTELKISLQPGFWIQQDTKIETPNANPLQLLPENRTCSVAKVCHIVN